MMNSVPSVITQIFILYLCIGVNHGYFITVDAHAEECFSEKVSTGTKLGLTFEVAEGGFLDIDVEVSFTISALLFVFEDKTHNDF